MKLEVEIDETIAWQIEKAAHLTGLPPDEICRRAIMTFCWISPQARWEFLYLLDHPLLERGLALYRVADLLEAIRREQPKRRDA